MTREQIKKLSHNDLIKKYETILTSQIFTAEDAIILNRLSNELEMRKDICLGMIPCEFLSRINNPIEAITKISIPEKTVDIHLLVIDKESIPEIHGLKKYSFGYAYDPKKTFDGENIVETFTQILPIDIKTNSVVIVKVKSITPIKNEKLYGIDVNTPLAFEITKSRVDSAVEIMRKAHAAQCLTLTQEIAIDLNRCGIIKVNIDEMFGVRMDKQMQIIKDVAFAKEGIFYAIVYPADEIDTDGDSATADEVQKACWKFMEEHQKMNFMHKDALTDNDVSIVECAVALADAPQFHLSKGDWYMAVRVKNKELRDMIDRGEITGFSMEGSALPGD